MATNEVNDQDILLAQQILSASGRHDTAALKVLLKNGGSANVRDDKRTTPLHAAIAAGTPENEAEVVKTVALLLENGAIWNDTDTDDDTPGCIALRLGLKDVYEQMVQAGVRAELLFNAMSAMGLAGDTTKHFENIEYDEDDSDVEIIDAEDADETESTDLTSQNNETRTADPIPEPSTAKDAPPADWFDVSQSNTAYLSTPLRYRDEILLDSSDNAVMMSWEKTIMERHAETLLSTPGLTVLNVGHGMGIVDTAIQTHAPAHHHIIEAHPQVLARLREKGWFDNPKVTIWEGRWQDCVVRMQAAGVRLDAIYYDTFAEDYAAFKDFVEEGVIPLLAEDGKFGWYNGLGADRQICYDIYTRVAEMDLNEMGFETVWEDVRVPADLHGHKDWEGTVRPYWKIDVYRLPVNRFIK